MKLFVIVVFLSLFASQAVALSFFDSILLGVGKTINSVLAVQNAGFVAQASAAPVVSVAEFDSVLSYAQSNLVSFNENSDVGKYVQAFNEKGVSSAQFNVVKDGKTVYSFYAVFSGGKIVSVSRVYSQMYASAVVDVEYNAARELVPFLTGASITPDEARNLFMGKYLSGKIVVKPDYVVDVFYEVS